MFERFTPEARQIVVRAQEQARELGHGYIGTEHLLLALLQSDPDLPAVRALAEVGITHDAARTLVMRVVGEGEGAPSGHIPFTPRSKKTLELSLREALRLKHKDLRPEHMLLGLIREGEGVAVQIMTELGADLPRLRDDVLQQMPEPGKVRAIRLQPGLSGPIRATPAGAAVSTRALAIAGERHLGSQDYLLALLQDKQSMAGKALAGLGVTTEGVQKQLAQLSPADTSDELPERAGGRRTSLQVLGDTIAIRLEESELAARLRPHFERLKTDVLHGMNLPGSDRIWKAVLPAIQETVRDLDQPAAQWTPPGWSQTGLACYAMTSRPDGFTSALWAAVPGGVDQARSFLATFLPALPTAVDQHAVCLTVAMARHCELYPDSDTPDAWAVSQLTFALGPAPSDWPRVPVADLLAAAIDDVRRTPPPEPGPRPGAAAEGS